ncbi:hypothetical protein DL991_10610 [Amycolatopsis sp. WAC 01375]|nr:hypothetical protein DL991_10610 [Amycolatopsis sp. WAC 01375]
MIGEATMDEQSVHTLAYECAEPERKQQRDQKRIAVKIGLADQCSSAISRRAVVTVRECRQNRESR